MKLNVLLAKTDHLASVFKNLLKDYRSFFKDNQGSFKGERRTYQPKEGTIDVPGKRSHKQVVTTVKEKLNYFEDTAKDYIDALFTVEATNASGTARTHLVVNGYDFGILSSLELLRLKSLVESGDVGDLYSHIPVRAEDELWDVSMEEDHAGREIWCNKRITGVEKSTIKESYILQDPNISSLKDASSYKPQLGSKDTVIELGEYSYQKFSGEYTHVQRAGILERRSKLLTAIIEALKICNEVEAVPSQMNSTKLFDYLHGR